MVADCLAAGGLVILWRCVVTSSGVLLLLTHAQNITSLKWLVASVLLRLPPIQGSFFILMDLRLNILSPPLHKSLVGRFSQLMCRFDGSIGSIVVWAL